MERAYLLVVRREGDTWVVDDDSIHHLEDASGGGCRALELRVQSFRLLASTPEEEFRFAEGTAGTERL